MLFTTAVVGQTLTAALPDQSDEMVEVLEEMIAQMNSSRLIHEDVLNFREIQGELTGFKNLARIPKLAPTRAPGLTLLEHILSDKQFYLGRLRLYDEDLSEIEDQLAGDWEANLPRIAESQVRWALVEFMTRRAKALYLSANLHYIKKLKPCRWEIKELEDTRVANLLCGMDVVAMTTSGASRFRRQLNQVGAKVVLVEEAAEVLEAQIVTSVASETDQLILIGDHLQLRPNVNSFVLKKRFGLSTSLFERLVHLGVRNVRLNTQRRMRPQISQLVRLFYPDLQDHDSIKKLPHVR